jgi:hypothetical protein
MFLANRVIALGWALKACANRLFTTARWLVPEAQRFLVHRTGAHDRNWRIFALAVELGTFLSRERLLAVVAGFLIVLLSFGLAMRGTATGTQPLVENFALEHESRTPSKSEVLSVNKSPEPTQGFVAETGSLSGAQIAPVPLPLRKPERVYKTPNGKGAKAIPATQKRMTQQKRSRPKPMR